MRIGGNADEGEERNVSGVEARVNGKGETREEARQELRGTKESTREGEKEAGERGKRNRPGASGKNMEKLCEPCWHHTILLGTSVVTFRIES